MVLFCLVCCFLTCYGTVLSHVVLSSMSFYRFASCGSSIMSFYRFVSCGTFYHVILPFCLVWYFLACHFTVLSRVVLSSMSFYRFVSCGTSIMSLYRFLLSGICKHCEHWWTLYSVNTWCNQSMHTNSISVVNSTIQHRGIIERIMFCITQRKM